MLIFFEKIFKKLLTNRRKCGIIVGPHAGARLRGGAEFPLPSPYGNFLWAKVKDKYGHNFPVNGTIRTIYLTFIKIFDIIKEKMIKNYHFRPNFVNFLSFTGEFRLKSGENW